MAATAAVPFSAMQPLKAQVRKGRLVLDAPTDRAEGEAIELVPLDDWLANGGDCLDDDERAALGASGRAHLAATQSRTAMAARLAALLNDLFSAR